MGQILEAGEGADGRTMAAGAVQRMSMVRMASFAGPLVPLSLSPLHIQDIQDIQAGGQPWQSWQVHVHACWIVASYSASGPPVPDMDRARSHRHRSQSQRRPPAIQPPSHLPPSHDGCHRCLDGPR